MKKNITHYPEIEENLLKKLKEDFPDKLPEKEVTNYQLGFLIGQQSVIQKLEAEYQEQNGEE